MKKQLVFLVLFVAAYLSATAQPNKKVGPALTKFLNTEFMVKYRDLRISAESAALGAQSNQGALQQADMFRLRSAYDQTATRANQLLDNIKQDFLNAKKLKSISEFPDMYSDGLRYKLQELADFYTANFQQVLADASVSKDEVDGSAVLLLVVELIGLTKGLTNYFGDIKREARQYTEAHLQEHLVQPYRWRYWDELAGSASPYEKFDKSSELNLNQPKTDDALDQQLQKLNQTISTLPAKDTNTGNNDWTGASGFDPPAEGELPADSSSTLRYDDWSPTEPAADPGAGKNTPDKSLKPAAKPAPANKPAAGTPKSKANNSGQ